MPRRPPFNSQGVFEFLWADSPEFQWEWKCLGYTRFIVLRHNEAFPHECVCIPISTGGPSKHEFAKPGIDSFQQGYVFANGDPNPGYDQPRGGPKLTYSPVGIEVRPGRLRVKEDSRANYADIVNVDPDAQVMVVGDVVKYFDRVRRNVNKAYMRQTLRTALEKYQAEKAANSARPASIMESVDGDHGGAECKADTYTLNESPIDEEIESPIREPSILEGSEGSEGSERSERSPRRERRQRQRKSSAEKEAAASGPQPSVTALFTGPRVSTPFVMTAPLEEDSRALAVDRQLKPQKTGECDTRSMHNVALAGLK
ncbi:hypothetical protein F5Y17DRAFT_348415 [Xylariaceae sp. FL0594]|nr:hypothetical protein F5Y17DRAFT_348415 [Xylariaceae sp. FL0594]